MTILAPLLQPRAQTSLEKRRSWLSHVEGAEVSRLALAVAVLLVDLPGAQFGVVRPNPRRLAGELKESLPAAIRGLSELADRGYLVALPKRAAGGGYRLLVPDSADSARTIGPSPSAAIPCSLVDGARSSARDIAARMVALPRPEADAHLQHVLNDARQEARRRCAVESEIERQVSEFRLLISAAYWCAVLTPGGAQ
jgi:hypothetical protein